MPFLTRLAAELAGEQGDRPVWRLSQPLRYLSPRYDVVVTVPAGFETDFASVPRWPLAWLLAGDTAHAPAVVHDYLYRTRRVRRSVADGIFYEAMSADQPELGIRAVPAWRRWLMWAAVRAAGWAAWRPRRVSGGRP